MQTSLLTKDCRGWWCAKQHNITAIDTETMGAIVLRIPKASHGALIALWMLQHRALGILVPPVSVSVEHA